ncbi:hypothetical protein [Dyella acidisoli]|uniref:Transposase n=1 Tax=Dyella acidisoli TaxID=1867834 RepID=A0ABQ5XUQ6_9GAMM|nr:hypothetical protein [Dyella acidisoli]GLQ95467.1 hypothetical protein GCM10007901_44220 [Dyella acidisoli]
MSIRNATIAMRKRKIGLFEQEHVAYMNDGLPRHNGTPRKTRKKDGAQPKKTARALWQDN